MPAGVLYRWEDNNHGLEHKCGTCKTVLSSPRAKKTCLGRHEEVCPKYHKTMFFVGASSHCDACHKTTELHDKRHREIANIVAEIQSSDERVFENSPVAYRKNRTKQNSQEEAQDDNDAPDKEGIWNDSSTLNDDTDTGSSHCGMDLETPEEKKAFKAAEKMAKNQAKVDTITEAMMKRLQQVLHPTSIKLPTRMGDDQGLVNNIIIEENISFNAHTFRWGHLRKSVHEKRLIKASNAPKVTAQSLQEEERIMVSVLHALGVDPKPLQASKQRRRLGGKLRTAIKADSIAYQNEQKETMQRMAGYWRYVNRRTYNAMVRTNQLWDWATGEKLPEFAESEIEEGDEDSVVASTDTASEETAVASQDNDDEGFGTTEGMTSDECTPRASTFFRVGDDEKEKSRAQKEDFEAQEDIVNGTLTLKHSYSPGRAPGPTLIFRVPSPSPSDDESECDDDVPSTLPSTLAAKAATTQETPCPPAKDSRMFDKTLHPASPSKPAPSTTPKPAYRTTASRRPPAKAPDFQPLPGFNAFSVLNSNTPAPNDEIPEPPDHRSTPASRSVPRISKDQADTADDGPGEDFPTLPPGKSTKDSGKKGKGVKVLSLLVTDKPTSAAVPAKKAGSAVEVAGRGVGKRNVGSVKAAPDAEGWQAVGMKERGKAKGRK